VYTARALNTAVWGPPPRSGHGRTMHGRVHGTYTDVHTGRKDGRVDGRARPCIRYVHGRVRAAYPAVFCHVPAAYTAVFGTRTDHVHGPCTAVYTVCTCTWPCTAMCTDCTRTWPCTGHEHGPSVTVYTAVFTARVHGGVRTVYMAVYTAVHGVYGPCAPACIGRVHSASTAVYRVHLHGRVLCTRPCLRPP